MRFSDSDIDTVNRPTESVAFANLAREARLRAQVEDARLTTFDLKLWRSDRSGLQLHQIAHLYGLTLEYVLSRLNAISAALELETGAYRVNLQELHHGLGMWTMFDTAEGD